MANRKNRAVVKFGGSNLRSKEDLQKILKVIRYYNTPLIIIVSACYGVTDMLINAISLARQRKGSVEEIKRSLKNIHFEIIDFYMKESRQGILVKSKTMDLINEVGKLIHGIYFKKEVPGSLEDKILSFGEKLASHILTSVLKSKKNKVREYLPENIGLKTDGNFHEASIDYNISGKNLKKHLPPDITCVIPGFYGVSGDGRITLFGRGGSDYSATSIARCLNAGSVDLWKDVHGFMSADPEHINNPKNISILSYDEAAELSYFGAKILHPRTFEPLYNKDIPIRIFNINNFSRSLSPLTIIKTGKGAIRKTIKSITFSKDFGILKLKGPGVGITPGILAEVSSALHNTKVNIKSVITSQTAINILISRSDLEQCTKIINEKRIKQIEKIEKIGDISVIAVVGNGLSEGTGIASRIFAAVSLHNINIRLISAGASNAAIYFIVNKEETSIAVKAVHNEFFNKFKRRITNEK
ncbi:MAG: aspartate kinase [Acidobacteriota bacterium]